MKLSHKILFALLGRTTFSRKKTPDAETERKPIQDVGWFPNPMWVMFVPVVSTSHITLQDDHLLSKMPYQHGVSSLISGYLVYVGDQEENWDDYPSNVQALCAWAFTHKYAWIRLDSDGDVIPHFPTFEW